MEVIEKINKYYEQSLMEKFSDADSKMFQKLVNDFKIHDKTKKRKKSKHWFYSLTQLSKPYFITLEKRQEFSKITEVLLNAFEKLTNAYHYNKELRNILLVKGAVSNYLNVNPGYSRKLLLARLDAFYNFSNDSLQFLEINCDIPGGMGYNDMLVQIFNLLPSVRSIRNDFAVCSDILLDHLCEMLLENYKEYCTNFRMHEESNPHIVFVCARNSDSRLEIDFTIEIFKRKGMKVSYADPRDFIYDGKILKLNGEQVDIVYRRENIRDIFRTDSTGKLHSNLRNKMMSYSKTACLNHRLLNRLIKRGYFGHTDDIIRAYADNKVCMINPFFSCICVQKSIFAAIQDKRFRMLFNEEELDVITKYLPWTRILQAGKTAYNNKEVDLIPFIKINRERFVLKPNMGFGGKGVIIGSEVNQNIWERKINRIIESGPKNVVQEYIEIPAESFPIYENGKLMRFSPQYVNLNFWGVNGKFTGSFIRASNKKVINVANGGRLVPVYYV